VLLVHIGYDEEVYVVGAHIRPRLVVDYSNYNELIKMKSRLEC